VDELQSWEVLNDTLHADCRIFDVRRLRCRHPVRAVESDFYIIDLPDWVVTLALTSQRELVLVRQFRFGSNELSLEIPAGVMEDGEDPLAAGVRELREETGYVGERARVIGSASPNPALQGNTCHFVLVENVHAVDRPQWDEHEEIHVSTLPVEDVMSLARRAEIRHAMVHTALFFLQPELERL